MPKLASSFPELGVRASASEGLPNPVEIILAQGPHKQTGNTQVYVTRWDAFQEPEATGWCYKKAILYHL